MKPRPFKVGDTVVPIRDVEASILAKVVGYEENERGYVIVVFADGIPRAMPVQSLEKPADRKNGPQSRPIGQGTIFSESTNLGDYLRRMGEADSISKKEQHK